MVSFQLPASTRSTWAATLVRPSACGARYGVTVARHGVEVVGRLGGQADEQQPGHLAQVDGAQRQAGRVDPALVDGGELRGVDEAAVGGVGPAVVAAHDVADRALRLLDEPGAAVAAHVAEGAHLLVVVAQHQHRGGAELDGDVVAGLGDLRDGADEDPLPLPQQRQVELVQVGVGVRRTGQRPVRLARVEHLDEVGAGLGGGRPGERAGAVRRVVGVGAGRAGVVVIGAPGQTVMHRRSESRTAAWMLRLATASPTRNSW